MALLETAPALDECDPADFDAMMVCGGQAPMFQFEDAENLHAALATFHKSGRPPAALCHGTSALLYVDGVRFVGGKRMTGFANSEEDMAEGIVGQKKSCLTELRTRRAQKVRISSPAQHLNPSRSRMAI